MYPYKGGGWVGANAPCNTLQLRHEVDPLLSTHAQLACSFVGVGPGPHTPPSTVLLIN